MKVRVKVGARSCPVFIGRGVPAKTSSIARKHFPGRVIYVCSSRSRRLSVDAAIGGKTGVDLPEGHRLAGVFHQPGAVVFGTAIRSSLSRRQSRAGLAEVVEHGIVMSPRFFSWLDRNAPRLACGEGKGSGKGGHRVKPDEGR